MSACGMLREKRVVDQLHVGAHLFAFEVSELGRRAAVDPVVRGDQDERRARAPLLAREGGAAEREHGFVGAAPAREQRRQAPVCTGRDCQDRASARPRTIPAIARSAPSDTSSAIRRPIMSLATAGSDEPLSMPSSQRRLPPASAAPRSGETFRPTRSRCSRCRGCPRRRRSGRSP